MVGLFELTFDSYSASLGIQLHYLYWCVHSTPVLARRSYGHKISLVKEGDWSTELWIIVQRKVRSSRHLVVVCVIHPAVFTCESVS